MYTWPISGRPRKALTILLHSGICYPGHRWRILIRPGTGVHFQRRLPYRTAGRSAVLTPNVDLTSIPSHSLQSPAGLLPQPQDHQAHVYMNAPFQIFEKCHLIPHPQASPAQCPQGFQRAVGTSRSNRGLHCYSARRHSGGPFPKGVSKRMKAFILFSLSTPPTPQEAGPLALTSHLADI